VDIGSKTDAGSSMSGSYRVSIKQMKAHDVLYRNASWNKQQERPNRGVSPLYELSEKYGKSVQGKESPGSITGSSLGDPHGPSPNTRAASSPSWGDFSTYQGISYEDSGFTPPDVAMCVGDGWVIQVTNGAVKFTSSIDMTQPSWSTITSLSSFFYSTGWFVFDPICIYDGDTGRFFVAASANLTGANPIQSRLLIATNQVRGSLRSWYVYYWDTQTDGYDCVDGSRCFEDYPQLGLDRYGFYITTNVFYAYPSRFVYARVWAFSKHSMDTVRSGGFTAWWWIVRNAFGIRASITAIGGSHYTARGGAVFLAYNDGANFRMGALVNTASLDYSSVAVTIRWAGALAMSSYSGPVSVNQRVVTTDSSGGNCYASYRDGNIKSLDARDSRLTQMYWSGAVGRLITSFMIDFGGGNNAIRYVIAVPSIDEYNNVGGYLYKQWNLYSGSRSLFYPSIAVSRTGRGLLLFSVMGFDLYPSAAVWPFNWDGEIASTFYYIGYGAGYYYSTEDSPARWGDYQTVAIEDSGTVWAAGEFVGYRTSSACTDKAWTVALNRVSWEREYQVSTYARSHNTGMSLSCNWATAYGSGYYDYIAIMPPDVDWLSGSAVLSSPYLAYQYASVYYVYAGYGSGWLPQGEYVCRYMSYDYSVYGYRSRAVSAPFTVENVAYAPGRIRAAIDYAYGGLFVAYYDTTSYNSGNCGPTNDGIDKIASDDSVQFGTICSLAAIFQGEWIKYKIYFSYSTHYRITLRASAYCPAVRTCFGARHLSITFPGIGTVNVVLSRGSANTWANTVVTTPFVISTGYHFMTLNFNADYLQVNYLDFEQYTPPSPTRRLRTPTKRRVTATVKGRATPTKKRALTTPRRATPTKRRATPSKRRATPSKRRATPTKRRATPTKRRTPTRRL